MRFLAANRWQPVGNGFIRGETVPDSAPLWYGHSHRSWGEAELFTPHSRVQLSCLAPPCEGEVIITAVTSAAEVIAGETGVWIDFHGVGPLAIEGEPVDFV